MQTIQVVLEENLLLAADRAARKQKVNRSALFREALRAYLRHLSIREMEEQDRAGYELHPDDKPRPVLVLTRSSAIRYLARVTVAPITSSIRGVPSEVVLDVGDGMKQPCAVNLHNAVTVAKNGLGRRLAQLSPEKMRSVCQALGFALGCDG